MSLIKNQRSRRPYSYPAYGNVALVQYGSGKPDCAVGDPTERRLWAVHVDRHEWRTADFGGVAEKFVARRESGLSLFALWS